MILQRILLILVSLTLVTPSIVYAEIPTYVGPNSQRFSGSEYYVGDSLGKPLIAIKLLSGVQKPGVYHVPKGTDLSELLSYAGGVNKNAHIDEVLVKRNYLGVTKNYEVDLEKILKSTSSVPRLADNDVVYIETDANLEQTVRWVSIVSGIVTIALTTFLIVDRSKD